MYWACFYLMTRRPLSSTRTDTLLPHTPLCRPRSHGRGKGRLPLHTVSALAARQRLVLGQEATDAKSNEITAIPRLLERLELAGALVTIDAMGTQTAIAEAILAKGGDYLLALKANRPLTFHEVERFFAAPPAHLTATALATLANTPAPPHPH